MLRHRKAVLSLLALMSFGAGSACAGPAYTVTVVPTLPGDFGGGAISLNASGQVIGSNNTPSGHTAGYLYSNGTMTNLGLLPGGTTCDPQDINASGQIVGFADNAPHSRPGERSEPPIAPNHHDTPLHVVR